MLQNKPPAASPLAGRIASLIANITNKSEPIINEGIDTNAVVITIITLSMNLFRRSAAMEPSTIPTASALNAAIKPSLIETPIPSIITSVTVRPLCFKEGPKSNSVTMSFKYVTYCSPTGLSRPYLASNAACASAVSAFSLIKGPPGTARVTKNVTVITTQTVTTARRRRFKM